MKVQRKGSNSGFHFYSLYQCCQRKFYLRMGPPRLEPMFLPTPLLMGSAFHAGKALFYTSGGKEKLALSLIRDELKERKSEFQNREEYLFTLERTPAMLASWIAEYGKSDLKFLKIIDVEKALKVPFPGKPSWHMTMRLDMVAEDRFDNLLVYETKSTSWSMVATAMYVSLGDQATTYIGGAEHHYKRKVTAVVPDITFFSKAAKNESAIKNYRGDFVYREPEHVKFFYRSIAQTASEIGQKMKAVYAGHDPAIFPRNSFYCVAYGRPCEFSDICRENITAKSKPVGFRKRSGQFKTPEIFDQAEDGLAES